MKKRIMILVAVFMLLHISAACAEIHLQIEKPADWEQRNILRVSFLPAEQNDCILLECGGESMLIDGGVALWRDRLYETLEARGLTELTYFFNTHPHDDHIGAVTKLIGRGTVHAQKFLSVFPATDRSEPMQKLQQKLELFSIPYEQLEPLSSLSLGNALLTLYAYPALVDYNSGSCGMHVQFGSASLLLTADWPGDISRWFAQNYPDVHAEIIKAPHHGINRFMPEFLDSVSPELVVFTNSRKNTTYQTTQLVNRSITPMHTSMGTIILETDGTDWYITQEKGWH